MAEFLSQLSRWTSLFAKWFAGLGLLLMTLIIAWQVFARYVLNASPAWAEQAALLLMIWYVMFAAAAGVREGFHIRITVFAENLSETPRRAVRIVNHSIVGLFGLAMAVWGTELLIGVWEHVIPTLGISRGYAYLPIPLAGVLILGYSIEHIAAVLTRREVPTLWS